MTRNNGLNGFAQLNGLNGFLDILHERILTAKLYRKTRTTRLNPFNSCGKSLDWQRLATNGKPGGGVITSVNYDLHKVKTLGVNYIFNCKHAIAKTHLQDEVKYAE